MGQNGSFSGKPGILPGRASDESGRGRRSLPGRLLWQMRQSPRQVPEGLQKTDPAPH